MTLVAALNCRWLSQLAIAFITQRCHQRRLNTTIKALPCVADGLGSKGRMAISASKRHNHLANRSTGQHSAWHFHRREPAE
jgi:hypothetical protein